MSTDKNPKPVTPSAGKPAQPSNYDMFDSLKRVRAAKQERRTPSPADEKTALEEKDLS
jgi:hypothetical protein